MTVSHCLRAACVTILSLGLGAAAPISNGSPIGRWTPVGSDCTVTDGMVQVTARLLVGDEVACRFARQAPGGRQAWIGTCADLDGTAMSQVALMRQGQHLTLAFDGGPAVTYRRCAKH